MGNPFQSSTGSTTNQSGTQNLSGSTTTAGSSTTTPNEDPLFSMFRQSILPAIAKQYQDAQQPVYGDAQTADVINKANNNYAGASQSIANNAARRGTLNSGSTDAANTALDQSRAAGITQFTNQIPFLNQQAQFGKTQDLLGLATNFLGRSPLGQTTTSSGSGTSQSQGSSTQQGSQTNTSTPSLWSDIGGVAGVLAGI